MGYTSSVHAVLYPPEEHIPGLEVSKAARVDKYGLLKTMLNTTYKDLVDAWSGYKAFTFHDDALFVEFVLHDIKWYDDFPQVSGFMAMMTELSDLEFAYEFVRVGEEEGDVEIDRSGNHDYKLQVQTTTEIIA